jgi:hypothetical protein
MKLIITDQREAIEVFIRAKEINVIDFSAEEIDKIYSFKTEKNFKGITRPLRKNKPNPILQKLH